MHSRNGLPSSPSQREGEARWLAAEAGVLSTIGDLGGQLHSCSCLCRLLWRLEHGVKVHFRWTLENVHVIQRNTTLYRYKVFNSLVSICQSLDFGTPDCTEGGSLISLSSYSAFMLGEVGSCAYHCTGQYLYVHHYDNV